jgi:excisionase family DNA binding protein
MKMYTLLEISEILNVSVESVRRYVRSGKLKASRVGRLWRVQEEDLKKYLEKNSNNIVQN